MQMIKEEIIKAFKKMHEQHPPRGEKTVYVTDLLHCVLRPEEEIPPIQLIRGTVIHEGIEKLLKHYGELEIEFEKEVKKQYGEYTLMGRLDGITKDGTIIEFKSVHIPPEFPYEQHIYQVLIYIHMTEAKQGLIVYIGSNDIEEFLIKRDKVGKIETWVVKRMETGEITFAQYDINDNWIYEQIIAYVTKTLIAPFQECKFCKLNKSCKFSKIR
ncbi:lipothrixviral CRISPR-associated protein Cas4 [Sulfolobus islandicus filamentous virus 2]|uniref:Lipothrixviral CRISPR-associated protein Cas4 n=1 Tax=Sulfolobus islandicus filamentous virus 2 TaxID=1902331 RepID=A0A1D8BJ67_SIFV|nr:lipothrixviral CRISPR-associated protein Cas4 [Sulfolobus islandicus filamentous virus 2]